jgi:hypothetical protein
MVSFSIKIYGSILNINLKWFIGQEIIWNEVYYIYICSYWKRNKFLKKFKISLTISKHPVETQSELLRVYEYQDEYIY